MVARHPQTLAEYNGRTVEIDCGLAEVLPAMWSAGVRTFGSCENYRGRGTVMLWFEDEESSAHVRAVTKAKRVGGQRWPLQLSLTELEEAFIRGAGKDGSTATGPAEPAAPHDERSNA